MHILLLDITEGVSEPKVGAFPANSRVFVVVLQRSSSRQSFDSNDLSLCLKVNKLVGHLALNFPTYTLRHLKMR